MIDIDATLITLTPRKRERRSTSSPGSGHPLLAYLDESHEALAGMLRPGGAPAHSAQAQIEVLNQALAQLPVEVVSDLDTDIVMRIEAAGAATTLCQAAQDAGINFLVGLDLFTGVREAILSLPEDAWCQAIRQHGTEREGAQIAVITYVDRLDLTPWPDGSRVIVRGERPHPGAQLTFTDHEGHRFQPRSPIWRATRSRSSACIAAERRVRIRAAKQTGIENLPFREFALNAIWLELSMIAQDLIAWTQSLCLRGELAICEPKALRYRNADLAFMPTSAWLPAAAHRGPARVPRPARCPAPPSRLVMGPTARRRRPPGSRHSLARGTSSSLSMLKA